LLLKLKKGIGSSNHEHCKSYLNEANEDDASLFHSLGEQVHEGAGASVQDCWDAVSDTDLLLRVAIKVKVDGQIWGEVLDAHHDHHLGEEAEEEARF
jgi:hypothetical protein